MDYEVREVSEVKGMREPINNYFVMIVSMSAV